MDFSAQKMRFFKTQSKVLSTVSYKVQLSWHHISSDSVSFVLLFVL